VVNDLSDEPPVVMIATIVVKKVMEILSGYK
jgi:hypothetical protein